MSESLKVKLCKHCKKMSTDMKVCKHCGKKLGWTSVTSKHFDKRGKCTICGGQLWKYNVAFQGQKEFCQECGILSDIKKEDKPIKPLQPNQLFERDENGRPILPDVSGIYFVQKRQLLLKEYEMALKEWEYQQNKNE